MQEANSFNDQKQILIQFYNLLIESNIHMPDQEVLEYLRQNPDPKVEEGLQLIRKYKFNAKMQAKKYKFNQAMEKLEKLLSGNIDKLINTLQKKPENEQLVALFRKYEDLSDTDKSKMLEDKHLLSLLKDLDSDNINNDNASE